MKRKAVEEGAKRGERERERMIEKLRGRERERERGMVASEKGKERT